MFSFSLATLLELRFYALPYLPARDATYEAELFGLSTEAWESSIERSGVDFPETDGEQKVLCAKYQSKPKTSRCDQVDLWSCELCVCVFCRFGSCGQKKGGTKYRATFGQHKITDLAWILFLHWYLGHIGHFVHHKPPGNNWLQIATAYSLGGYPTGTHHKATKQVLTKPLFSARQSCASQIRTSTCANV